MDPLWAELEALLGSRPVFSPTHPWGCHRRRIPDRGVREYIVEAMVHGSGYEIIASRGCSDRTIRRRVVEWAGRGLGQKLHEIALAAYDRSLGWSWRPGDRWLHHESPVWWGKSRSVTSRSPQRPPETLGRHRHRRRAPGDRFGRGNGPRPPSVSPSTGG